MSDFRQAGRVSARKFPKRGNGGGAPRWVNKFQPSTVEPDMIRFIPGEYLYVAVNDEGVAENLALPYMRFSEHFDGRTKQSTICSAGPYVMYKDKRDDCLGCDLFWEGGGKKDGRVSRREMYSFSIFNYGTFHEVDQVDGQGNLRINEKTNKPYTTWARCTGRRICDACAANKPTKKGHMQHWEMGYGHFQSLKDYAKTVGRNCKSCKGKNTMQALAYLCGNCKDAVIDMATSTLSDEEIAKIIEQENVCPHCHFSGYLEEVVECTNCQNGIRAGIFDVDIYVKRVQGDGNQTTLHFTEHGPVADMDPKYDAKPLDLEGKYTPDTLEKQSNTFKEPIRQRVPKQPVPASQVAKPYGAPAPAPVPAPAPTPAPAPRTGGGGMFSR